MTSCRKVPLSSSSEWLKLSFRKKHDFLEIGSHRLDNHNPHFRGWRKAVVLAAIVTGLVLLCNLILAVVGAVKYTSIDGVSVIYRGDCSVVKRWNTASHIIINLLGTALLAASSFTMQCLTSPTRSEVDAAHAKKKSLNIGLLSFTNLFYVRPWKVRVCLLLFLSSMPLHLL